MPNNITEVFSADVDSLYTINTMHEDSISLPNEI